MELERELERNLKMNNWLKEQEQGVSQLELEK